MSANALPVRVVAFSTFIGSRIWRRSSLQLSILNELGELIDCEPWSSAMDHLISVGVDQGQALKTRAIAGHHFRDRFLVMAFDETFHLHVT